MPKLHMSRPSLRVLLTLLRLAPGIEGASAQEQQRRSWEASERCTLAAELAEEAAQRERIQASEPLGPTYPGRRQCCFGQCIRAGQDPKLSRKHLKLARPLCLETGCVLPGIVHVCRNKFEQRKPIQGVPASCAFKRAFVLFRQAPTSECCSE